MKQVEEIVVQPERPPERGVGPGLGRIAAGAAARPLLVAFVTTMVAKHGWVVAQVSVSTWRTHLFPALGTAGAILAVSAFANLWQGRKQLAALVAIDVVLTSVLYGDLLHYRAFGALSSAASLAFAWQLGDVAGSVTSLVRLPADLVLFADVAIFGVGLFAPAMRSVPRLSARRVAALALGGAVVSASVAVASPRLRYRSYQGHAYVAGHVGLFAYHAWDVALALERLGDRAMGDPEAVEEAAERFEPKWEGRPAPHPSLAGVSRGLDVIVLQLESFQGYAVGLEVEGQKVTPRLDELARESLRFPSFFQQTGRGSTSDAQFLALCSLHASSTGAVAFEYAGNDLHCLPEVLRDAGYRTLFLHPYHPDFWNRAATNPGQGFDRSYSERDFDIDETIGLGLSDASFLRQAADVLEQTPHPWFAFLITLTSHAPFDFPELPRTLDLGALEGTPAGRYLHAVHYTDGAVGAFVDRLRETGRLDRTLLVVYGDHQGTPRRSTNVADVVPLRVDDTFGWFVEEKRVPLLVRLPGGAHAGEIGTIGGQIDLAPTLRRLLGVPGGGLAFMGYDLLSPERPRRAIFPDGSVLSDGLLHLSGETDLGRESCLGPEGVMPSSACSRLADQAADELELSGDILEGNLVPAIRKEWAERGKERE